MPSNTSPLTIILNANQSKRAIYLLPLDAPSQHSLILTEARNKFRLKSLSQIYLKGGTLFLPDQTLHLDVREVWVSKGEPYVGKDAPTPGVVGSNTADREVRVDVIAEESYVDPEAVKQLKAVAGLEGVVAAIGMPDLHPGNRFPVGCAIAAHGVYPALIGTDVGCGIALYRLAATPSRFAPSKIASRLRGLDDPWDGNVSAWLAERGVHKESDFDKLSLGTVGAGNHFAEICVVEDIKDEEACERIGVRNGVVYLLVHTGSRGLGKSILEAHSQTNSNPFYPDGSPELNAYLEEHDYAVQWAVANRDLVAYRIASCLGLTLEDNDETEHTQSRPVMPEKLVDVTHNSVTKHNLSIGSQESQDVWVHRKGAAPANMGVAPCPGSRGDFSWLLQPVGDGNDNAHSLAHGAGRLHPRSAATLRKNVPGSTTNLGSEVVCTDPALMIEERPEAYKGVQAVVNDLEKRGCARGIAKLRPIVTYKVRNEFTKK
ncbi:tRNA-splicing ligase RtcB [Rhizoctonia solani 123E]|uniref:3'-phosphate/5'-hydroxy nucleic acid ligase n=1 Tax=Rhizoctonia solani 123E TaxID=1423351 RepID=A0A074SQY4_9AGAM|nr:tRNA-splicing ligase RtcB [Rhizoctonia solani 123E]